MSAIDDLPPLREVIRQHALSARKSLGQNFLLDLNLTRRIARLAVRCCAPKGHRAEDDAMKREPTRRAILRNGSVGWVELFAKPINRYCGW